MTDENESREPTDRSANHTSRGAVIFVAVLVCYVLSPIPVAWGLARLGLYNHVQTAYETFYAPLAYLVKHVAFLDSFYEWQVRRFL